jgi:hypothetical protein
VAALSNAAMNSVQHRSALQSAQLADASARLESGNFWTPVRHEPKIPAATPLICHAFQLGPLEGQYAIDVTPPPFQFIYMIGA